MVENKIKKLLLIFILELTSILSSLILFLERNNNYSFRNYWILPLVFGVVLLLSKQIHKYLLRSYIISVFVLSYYLKSVIIPFVTYLGNYKVVFRFLSEVSINDAIWLSIYELIIVFIMFNYYISRKSNRQYHNSKLILTDRISKSTHSKIFASITLLAILLIIEPAILGMFSSIFESSDQIVLLDYNINATMKNRDIVLLFVFVFDTIRYVIPIYLIILFNSRISNIILKKTLIMFVALSPILVVSGSNIQPFIGIIMNFIVIINIMPEFKKTMIMVVGFISLIAFIGVILAKGKILGNIYGDSIYEYFSVTLNAYIPTISNTAAVQNINPGNKAVLFISDVISTVPFRNTLLPFASNFNDNLVTIFNSSNYTSGNLISLIGASKFYLGWVLSPLIPLAIYIYSDKLELKSLTVNNIMQKFIIIYLFIRISLIPLFYNHVSLISIYLNSYLLLVFLLYDSNLRNNHVRRGNYEKN